MDGDSIAQLLYLGVLAVAVFGWFAAESYRQNMNKTMQQAAVWGLIFMGVIAVYGLWEDISNTAAPRQTSSGNEIVLPQASDGHFYATLQINGVPVNFVVDTGATQVVLTRRDAKRIGLNPDKLAYIGQADTANGVVGTAFVTLETVALENTRHKNVRAAVNEGQMRESLLGMSYLSRFDSVRMEGNRMVLVAP